MINTKFRGKATSGEWVCGDLITDTREFNRTCDGASILPHWEKLNCPISVDKSTVGQYTGIHDRHGVAIYDGDIVEFEDVGEEYSGEYLEAYDFTNKATVIFADGRFMLDNFASGCSAVREEMYDHQELASVFKSCEVVGNIYEKEGEK